MGSKGTSQYTTTQAPPAWLQSAYMGAVGQAQQAAAQPFVPYGGEYVAPVNAQETAGIGQINQYANWAQPFLNAAAGYATNAAAPIQPGDISRYANPYTQNVLGATEQEMALLNAQQNQGVIGNAISSGAWGGDRAAVAQAELAGQQTKAEAPVFAGIASQGYNTGISTALAEQQQEAQAAYSLGNIGQAAQNAGLTGAGAMIQGGQLQQGTQQNIDTAALQAYYTKLGYPFQVASWLANVAGGIGGVAGGTSTTTAPSPNPLSSILGLGLAGAGAAGGLGWKPFAARGGGIGYQDGGAPSEPYSGGIRFIPSIQPSRGGQGLPKPPIDPSFMLMYGNRQGAGGLPSLESGIAGLKSLKGDGTHPSDPLGIDDPDSAYNRGILAGLPTSSEDAIYAGGGGVFPEHAGLGFAGDDPTGVDDPESTYNRFPTTMGGSSAGSTIRPPSVDATDIVLPEGSGGYGRGEPFAYTNPALEADRGIGSARPTASAYPPTRPDITDPLNRGVGSSRYTGPSYEEAATRPQDTRSTFEKLSLPLMQAGFAMMASRSPFLGEAIGAGGLSGIGAYIAQEKEKRTAEEKQQDIALHAKQLSDLAQHQREQLAQTEKYQQEQIEERQATPHAIGSDMFGKPIYGVLDPKTKSYVDPITRQPIDMSKISEGREGNMQATAHMIANYRMPPISPFKAATPEGAALMAAVQKENPNYNAQYYNMANKARTDFASGPDGRAVQSFSVGISHADVLREAADALSGGNTTVIRGAVAKVQKVLGLSTAPTNFDAIKPIVAAELAKAIVGGRGGTQQDREEMAAGIQKELATASIQSVIDKYEDLMGGQLAGYERRYRKATMGASDFEEWLSAPAVNMLHKGQAQEEAAGERTSGATPAATPTTSATPPAAAPAPAASVPANVGDRVTGKTYGGNNFRDGKPRTWNGHGWDAAPAAP